MKTNLPESISTIEEAKAFLTELYENGEAFHPEDAAGDIVLVGHPDGITEFTDEECMKLDALMFQTYLVPENGDNYRTNPTNLVFDPCGFLLDLAKENGDDSPFSF